MPLNERIKNLIQVGGAVFSRVVFNESALKHASIRWLYLRLYDGFKYLFERREMADLAAKARLGSTVLDIGANTGWTAMHFAKAVGTSGRVVAFEPDPVARALGVYRTKDIKNISWEPCALGAEDGEMTFFQNLSNRADNRVFYDPVMMRNVKEIKVKVRSLSSVFREKPFTDVSLIKMDVQGYEERVILGMSDWLKGLTAKPIIAFEWWPYGLSKAGTPPENFLDGLKKLGYIVPESLEGTFNKVEEKDWYTSVVVMPR